MPQVSWGAEWGFGRVRNLEACIGVLRAEGMPAILTDGCEDDATNSLSRRSRASVSRTVTSSLGGAEDMSQE